MSATTAFPERKTFHEPKPERDDMQVPCVCRNKTMPTRDFRRRYETRSKISFISLDGTESTSCPQILTSLSPFDLELGARPRATL